MFFNNKKKIIKNPDEAIISFMENYDNKYVKEINNVDALSLAKILSQFDVKTVCRVLSVINVLKSIEIIKFMSKEKQDDIIKRMPSDFAAACVKESLHTIDN